MQAASRQCLFIAPEMLVLCACGLCLRLSSTLWLNGYLPVDATGDFVFQATDICSLFLVIWLLAVAYSEGSTAKRREEDEAKLPMVPVVLGACIVTAFIMHGEMNNRPLFDATWLAGLLLDCVAVAPQLQLISKSKGRVDAMTSHFMAAMALSRVCALVFFLGGLARHHMCPLRRRCQPHDVDDPRGPPRALRPHGELRALLCEGGADARPRQQRGAADMAQHLNGADPWPRQQRGAADMAPHLTCTCKECFVSYNSEGLNLRVSDSKRFLQSKPADTASEGS